MIEPVGNNAYIIGSKSGDLTLLSVLNNRRRGRIYGEFSCSCGNVVELAVGRVVNQENPSHCGCKTVLGTNIKHGMRGSPEYSSWMSMKQRCLKKYCKDYPRYGAVGISIHDRWINSFEEFFDHLGLRPEGTTLDRIDNTQGYYPGNVRWATLSEQQRNRRNTRTWTVKGVDFKTLKEAASHYRVTATTISRWVYGSFDKRDGIHTKPRSGCYATSKY